MHTLVSGTHAMALFTEALINQIIEAVQRQHHALGTALGVAPHSEPGQSQFPATSPLRSQLHLLVQVANGALARSSASDDREHEVEQALAALMTVLTSTALGLSAPLSDTFWRTEVGVLVSRVRWWLSADDLITISNAAALVFGENTQATRMRIVRAIESGLLEWIPDPSVANPQHNRRVLRSQVERLRDQRQLPI
jgi:hypothetical protein